MGVESPFWIRPDFETDYVMEVPERVLELLRAADGDPDNLDVSFGVRRVTLYRRRDYVAIKSVVWADAGLIAMRLLRERVREALDGHAERD